MSNIEEIWKDIPDYEGLYQVSNLGRVKSLPRGVKNSMIEFTTKEKILKQSLKGKFYLAVGLCKNGKLKLYYIHKLVSICFLNHKPSGYKEVINHIDENHLNNNVKNLEVTTQRKNTIHSKNKSKTSSKHIGVCYHKQNKKWQSNITLGKNNMYLGTFNTELEAKEAYDKKLNEINTNLERTKSRNNLL